MMKSFKFQWLIPAMLALALFSPLAFAEPPGDAPVKAELVSETKSIRPGETLWVALRLTMEEGWHTYWKNPGDSGLATSVQWTLPEGFRAGPLLWPAPEMIPALPLVSYGYEGRVFLLTAIEVPASLKPGSVQKIEARAKWLACKDICIPGKAELSLELPVSAEAPRKDIRWEDGFGNARRGLPLEKSDWRWKAFYSAKKISIFGEFPHGDGFAAEDAEFFPDSSEIILAAAPQELKAVKGGFVLSLERSGIGELPGRLEGVLVSRKDWTKEEGSKALRLEVPLVPFPAGREVPQPSSGLASIGTALLFAFLGGMILNLMPCVFPVLSLKILSFAGDAGADRKKILFHGLAYTAGILVSFWLLAGLLMVLRAAGNQIGWGFQLQSPSFLAFLAVLFFIFSLNLFGLFEIGTSLTRLGGNVSKGGGTGAFLSGVLATVVATPCTAPFMGSALAFALSEPLSVSFRIFTALGLGMAFPYMALSCFPVFLKRLPRPGMWMVHLRRFLGFLLALTVAWLLWVFGLQTSGGALALMAAGLFFILLGILTLKRVSSAGLWEGKGSFVRFVVFSVRFVGVVTILTGLLLAFGSSRIFRTSGAEEAQDRSPSGIPWEPFSPERFSELRAQGKPVFIDFTAAWCLTCQVNERLVLSDRRIVRKFSEEGIVALKADWTSRDERVTQALAQYGRNSVPLYVFYGRGGSEPPEILPELITPKMILRTIEKKVRKS